MKRSITLIVAVLLGMALNAQVSVWDGTSEPWTNGEGTEESPYLIENASQLAYMTYAEPDLAYYKLMTDIDIDNREWNPIGFVGEGTTGGNLVNVCFDGNNHTIYHLTTTLFFWVSEGYVKNLTIRDSDMVQQHGSNYFGGVANIAALVENCHNYGNLIIDYDDELPTENWFVGGIVGEGMVRNCDNHGRITVNVGPSVSFLYVGGVVGIAYEVETSFNKGEMAIESQSEHCYVGGICGKLENRVSYCYNNVDLLVESEGACVGGIVGMLSAYPGESATINSCYNAGNMEGTTVGGIVAKLQNDNMTVNAENNFYINTIASGNEYGTPQSESEMRTPEFVDVLNNGEDVYMMDDGNVNNGYPVFSGKGISSVDETLAVGMMDVYPNPSGDIVNISLAGDAVCNSVEIYSVDGRMAMSLRGGSGTINVSGLSSGVYVMKVRMADGSEFTERIVKE